MNKSTFSFFRGAMVALLLLCIFQAYAQQRLVVSPHMTVNISGRGDAWILFDNQNASNQACNIPQTTNPWAYYDGSWNGKSFYYPVSVVVDLGYPQNLNQICLRKAFGTTGTVDVYTGGTDASTWSNLYTQNQFSGECQTLNTFTQFLKFTFESNATRILEIELYGPQANTPECEPNPTTCDVAANCFCPRLPMEDFIGSNINVDVPVAKGNAVGFIRAYQHEYFNTGFLDVDYPGYPTGAYSWAPSKIEKFDHDYFYQGLHDVGLEINSSLHHAPPYLVTFDYWNGADQVQNSADAVASGFIDALTFIKLNERKPFDEQLYPITPNTKYDDPAMYLEFSDLIYQFSSRYGYPGNTSNLKVDGNNVAKAGLDLVQYVENWNEPDKWWHFYYVNGMPYLDTSIEEQLGYFSPYEYAAFSSATFDGHGETNGIENTVLDRYPNGIPSGARPVGLKNANSGMKNVMAGVSGLEIEYVKAVKFWFDHHRPDIGFPFDVINFHDYSNNGGPNPQGSFAISPEDDNLKEKVREVVEFRNKYIPDVEVWLSEFGYDTNPYSIQSPDCSYYCGNCSAPDCLEKMREIQGQWNVRSFLEVAAAGIDRAMVFNFRDGGAESDGGQYVSAGLLTNVDDGFKAKNSWYYISTMKTVTEGTKYDASFVHNDPSVRIYKFVEDCNGTGKTVYAIWSPTSVNGNDTPVKTNYQLPFVSSNATLVKMVDDDMDGIRQTVSTCGGTVCVDISERPIFIVEGDLPEDIAGCACNYVPFTVSGSGNVSVINDEQNNLGGLNCGEGNPAYSTWTAADNQSVVLDMGQLYELSSLYLHSDGSTGKFKIQFGTPGNWTDYSHWNVYNPTEHNYKWKTYTDIDVQTRYIRIKATTNNVNLQEVAICGEAVGGGPTCNDGIQNQGEAGVDCGGPCPACVTPTCNDGILNGNETGVDCGGSCPPCNTGSCQIALTPQMFYDQNGNSAATSGFGGSLADEQNVMGDPINGQGLDVTTGWQFPWQNGIQTYVDLGQTYNISGIYLYDGYGEGQFTVATGLPSSNNAPFISFNANAWPPQWRDFDGAQQQVSARYLTFTRVAGGATINEIAICGTPANGNPTCTDGVQNGNETGVDCGGSCPPCVTATCFDGIQNQGETGVDCGGPCPACISCNDGIQNGNETGVDCGGSCPACVTPTCFDGIQNGNETGVDCGGSCPPCNTGSCEIALTPQMFYDQLGNSASASGFGGSLADEQNVMGDPINGQGLDVSNGWQFPWQNGIETYVDLGQTYNISGIYLYDGYGEGQFTVATGLPSSGNAPFISFNANVWPPQWRDFDGAQQQVSARYLTFTRVAGGATINEIAICGTPANGNPTCTDGIQNGNETGLDCGGSCPPCSVTCFDGIQNGDETDIDCGGFNCPPCVSCNDGIQNGNETGVDCGGSCPPCNTGSCEIALTPQMFYDQNGNPASASNFAGSLADEQNVMGDPINGQGLDVNTPWQFPWQNGIQCYVDLGQTYNIDGVYLYDGYGEGQFTVSTGQPSNNNSPFISFNANAWPPQWRSFDGAQQQVTARYLTFTREAGGANINEIAICGTPINNLQSKVDENNIVFNAACPPIVFPSPTASRLVVQRDQSTFDGLIISDTKGQIKMDVDFGEVLTKTEIDVSHLRNGIYFLRLKGSDACPNALTRFVKMDTK